MPQRTWRHRLASHGWIWKSVVASLCGSLVHSALIYAKHRFDLLPGFEPNDALRAVIGNTVGSLGSPTMLAPLFLIDGSTVIGLLFGRFFHHLPGRSGLAKGFLLGLAGWGLLGAILFPAIGLGPFALGAGVGAAAFSFLMVQSYCLILGLVYARLDRF